MILAYDICGQDNGSFLNPDLYGKNVSDCIDFINNREKFITQDFKIKKTKYDISYTYDSALIVSQKFKDFCDQNNFIGINFHQLLSQTDFYLFKVRNIVEFDFKRRETEFLEFNKDVGKYNEVIGATPVCLKQKEPLMSGFYRTDIEFGRGYDQAPTIIAGISTYALIQKEKFKGLDAKVILDKYDWEE